MTFACTVDSPHHNDMPRLPEASPRRDITLDLEGEPLTAKEGDSVASALLAAREPVFARSVKYHRPRGPFCMTGACSHCLMRVDGVPNVFTCQTKVCHGMRVERQNAFPSAEHDVFGAIDWLFPKGLDHHAMFAGVPIAEQVMAKVARHLAGLGLLPDKVAPARVAHQTLRVRVAIAGAGAAGLAAARELMASGVEHLLLEREELPGGRLRYGALGPKDPPLSAFERAGLGNNARLSTTVLGLFDDEAGRFFAALSQTPQGPRLLKVYGERFLICTGGYPALWPFENNDLPGVFSARAVSVLLRRDRILAAERIALVGTGPELYDTARLILEHGGGVQVIVDLEDEPPADAPARAVRGEAHKAHGNSAVKGFTFRAADGGREERVDCDGVAVCLPTSPAFELARQGGASVSFVEALRGFAVDADEDGKTAGEGVYVAGDQLGQTTVAKAADRGVRAARAIIRSLGAEEGR